MSNKMYDGITGRSPIATDDLGYIGTGQKASQIMSGGTSDYDALTNKPTINNVELSGNKTSSDLGLQSALTTEQLSAVNSGVTAETVAQVGTNTTNISSLDSRTGFGTAVPNNTNIDNMTTIGTYYISTYTNAGTMTNLPIVRSGRLIVSALNTSSNGRLVQIYYPTWNDAEIIGKYYMRQLPTNDGWSNWYEYGGTEIVPTPSP